MTPEERNPKVHHQTVRGARLAIARKEIGQESYRAVLAGTLSLADAKRLGREGGPTPTGASEGPREGTEIPERQPSPCVCECGQHPKSPRSRFVQSHDAAAKSAVLKAVRANEVSELPPALRAYGAERGLIGG